VPAQPEHRRVHPPAPRISAASPRGASGVIGRTRLRALAPSTDVLRSRGDAVLALARPRTHCGLGRRSQQRAPERVFPTLAPAVVRSGPCGRDSPAWAAPGARSAGSSARPRLNEGVAPGPLQRVTRLTRCARTSCSASAGSIPTTAPAPPSPPPRAPKSRAQPRAPREHRRVGAFKPKPELAFNARPTRSATPPPSRLRQSRQPSPHPPRPHPRCRGSERRADGPPTGEPSPPRRRRAEPYAGADRTPAGALGVRAAARRQPPIAIRPGPTPPRPNQSDPSKRPLVRAAGSFRQLHELSCARPDHRSAATPRAPQTPQTRSALAPFRGASPPEARLLPAVKRSAPLRPARALSTARCRTRRPWGHPNTNESVPMRDRYPITTTSVRLRGGSFLRRHAFSRPSVSREPCSSSDVVSGLLPPMEERDAHALAPPARSPSAHLIGPA
jgi:hypothetical protein